MKVIFYVSYENLIKLQAGEEAGAVTNETHNYFRVEAELDEVEISQDQGGGSRYTVTKIGPATGTASVG